MRATEMLGLSPEQFAEIKSADIGSLVTAAVEIDRQIKELQSQLQGVKARLIREARKELNFERIQPFCGSSYSFRSECGEVASIAFPKPGLVRSFWLRDGQAWTVRNEERICLGDVKGAAGEHFEKLFARFWKPAKACRELVMVLLGKGKGEKLLQMITEESSPRVSFETGKAGGTIV